jgi:hypothetical protein
VVRVAEGILKLDGTMPTMKWNVDALPAKGRSDGNVESLNRK